MDELWTDISDFEGIYQISNFGRVRSLDRYCESKNGHRYFLSGKIIKPGWSTSGYLFAALCKNGKYTLRTIHRLVATAFIPNPENKPVINHIDGNKKNNVFTNLEWVTYKENSSHAKQMGLIGEVSKESRLRAGRINSEKQGKRVVCITNGEVYQSMKIASIKLNIPLSSVSRSVYRNRTYSGYKFKLLDESVKYKPIEDGTDLRTIKKKVYCITTGKLYNSAQDASEDCHLHCDTIRKSAKKHKSVGGLLFTYDISKYVGETLCK